MLPGNQGVRTRNQTRQIESNEIPHEIPSDTTEPPPGYSSPHNSIMEASFSGMDSLRINGAVDSRNFRNPDLRLSGCHRRTIIPSDEIDLGSYGLQSIDDDAKSEGSTLEGSQDDRDIVNPLLELPDEKNDKSLSTQDKEDEAWNPKANISKVLPRPVCSSHIVKEKVAVEKVLMAAAATPSSSKILKVHPKKKKRKPLTSKGTARRHVSSPLPGQSVHPTAKNNPIKLQDNVSFGGNFDLATNAVEPAVPAEVKVQNVCKKKFVCYHCGYRAKHFKTLKRHILIKHLNHKPFSCTQCDYRAVISSQLKTHVWAKHTDIKPFQCPLCNYNTAYRAHLKQHRVAMHSDIRPFKCKLCDFCTGYSCGLKRHVAARHTDTRPRPFQCKLCNYNTAYSHSLKQHVMHRHSDTKPFNCTQCAYRAALKSNLRRHIHTKHLFSKVSVIRTHFNLNS